MQETYSEEETGVEEDPAEEIVDISDVSDAIDEAEEADVGIESSEAEEPVLVKTARKPFRDWLETDDAVRTVYLVFGFFMILLLMVLLQFSTSAVCCGDWDGYYHIRWSALVWENFKSFQWLPDFNWLPLTVLNPTDYADHHFLFHLLQIPFLWLFEPVMAAKVASVFYGTLAIFSVYWLLFKHKIDYMLLWLGALLTCANPFFYRMNMAKAPPLTIIYSVIGIYLLFERKYIWLLPLMFAFVWTYSLFPLLFIAAAIWTAIIAWNEKKFEWQPLAYTTGGMVLGNIINPYFPNNLFLLWEHFSTKFRGTFEVAVGGEWYPYSGWQLITHLTVALAAMLIGYVLFRPRNGKLPEKATFFLVFATILLIWIFRSKRLAEYFPPFAILFCAFSWKSFFTPTAPELPEDFRREIEPFLDSEKTTEKGELIGAFKQTAPWVIGIFFVGLMFYNYIGINIKPFGMKYLEIKQEGLITSIRKNEPNDKYEEAMNWAVENIPAGERIFNCNWDDFPKMFFFDTKHSYVYGLDPNYLFSQDEELYKLVKEITDGKIDDPAPLIRDKFGSRYIFSDAKENEDFIAKILQSGWAETVYEDGEAYFIMIREDKGEPPPEADDAKPGTPEEEAELKKAEGEENKDDPNANANADPLDDEELEEDESDLDEIDDEMEPEDVEEFDPEEEVEGNSNDAQP